VSALLRWYSKNSLKIAPYTFIAPNIILFLVFMILPILATIYISFFKWDILGSPEFVGFANYVKLFKDSVFWTSIWNTVYYTIFTVPLSMIFGLLGALLLNRKVPLRAFFRGVFFAPVVVSLVATGLIWSWLYNPNYGLFNLLLSQFGIQPVNWLSSSAWSMPAVILTTLWVRIGYCLVIYLSGMQSIPEELYEAAEIDGANGKQKFFYITVPLLKQTTIFLMVTSIIYGFMVFDLIYTMTNGGPGHSTTVVVQYIYQKSFVEGLMGYGSAIGSFLFLILVIFTGIQLALGRDKNG
jgi:multiple sugar transport system permease protein/alpha-1,4-digalacturonate transport system permease protein